jgi:hypothetical protein
MALSMVTQHSPVTDRSTAVDRLGMALDLATQHSTVHSRIDPLSHCCSSAGNGTSSTAQSSTAQSSRPAAGTRRRCCTSSACPRANGGHQTHLASDRPRHLATWVAWVRIESSSKTESEQCEFTVQSCWMKRFEGGIRGSTVLSIDH